MDENRQQNVNRVQAANQNRQVQAQQPQQVDIKDFVKAKEYERSVSNGLKHAINIKLAEVKARETLSSSALKAKYTKKIKGANYDRDRTEARNKKNETDNRLLTTGSYRFCKYYKEELDTQKKELKDAEKKAVVDLSAETKLRIAGVEQERDLKIADINTPGYRERQRQLIYAREDLTDEQKAQNYHSNIEVYSDKALVNLAKANADFSIKDLKTTDKYNRINDINRNRLASAWMVKDDKAGNKRLYEAVWGNDEQFKEFLVSKAHEVLAYDFNINMLNINWLSENGDVLARMLNRCYAFEAYAEQDNLKGLDYETKLALLNKLDQVHGFKKMLEYKMAEWGLEDTDIIGEEEHRGLIIPKIKEEAAKADLRNRDPEKFTEAKTSFEKATKKINNYYEQKFLEVDKKEEYSENITKLRFADFLSVLGEKNRGQVVLNKKGGLSIINNSYIRRNKTGDESAENLRVKERFLKLALEQLSMKEKVYYRPLFVGILGLDRDQVTSKPLSRKAILEIMTEIRSRESLVSRTKALGDRVPLGAFAAKVNTFFGAIPSADDVKAVRNRKTRDLRNRLKTFIRNQAGRARVKLPSDKRLNKLINENMDYFKDEILRNAMRIDTILKNTGKNAEDTFLNGMNADALLEKLAVHVTKKLCSSSPSEVDIAEYGLDNAVVDMSLEAAGKPELKHMLSDANFGTLVSGSTLGLYELVEARRLENIKITREAKFNKDLDAFALLIESVCELKSFNSQLLTRNTADTGLDRNKVEETAKLIHGLVTNEPDRFADVLKVLKGTRFVTGFNELKAKIEGGFDIVKNEKDILDRLSAVRQVREEEQHVQVEGAVYRQLNKREESILASLDKDQKALANILLLQVIPSALFSKEDDGNAKSILALRRNLALAKKGHAFVTQLSFGNCKARLTGEENGSLKLSFGDKELALNVPADRVVEYIEADMCSNVKKYGKAVVYTNCFAKILYMDRDNMDFGDIAKTTDLAIKVLVSVTGKPAAYYEDLSTDMLFHLASNVLNDHSSNSEKSESATTAALTHRNININVHETLKLLRKLENEETELSDEEKLELNEQVIIRKNEKKAAAQDEPQWSEQELKVKELVADMIYGSTRALDEDLSEEENRRIQVDAERSAKIRKEEYDGDDKLKKSLTYGHLLRDSLFKHADAIHLILSSQNMEIIDRTIRRMSVPDPQPGQPDFKKMLIDAIKDSVKTLDREFALESKSEQEIGDILKAAKHDDSLSKKFEAHDAKIKDGVKKCCDAMQKEIEKAADQIFSYKEDVEDNDNLRPLNVKNLSRDEMLERRAEHTAELSKRIKKEALNTNGQGALNKMILCRYFKESSTQDQLSMVASIFRNSVPTNEPEENATEDEKKAEITRRRGNTLAGFFKGAGPLMQKMLQGMPEKALPPEMRLAVKDMKSKLMPIPEDVVRVRMRSIIERSNGNIEKIEVVRSLGAASVGQAFLCKLYGPNLPKTGKNTVIKLLRPDARNRMAREKALYDKLCRERDDTGTIGKTMKGQLEKITEELDLNQEALNVRRGAVYNNGDPTVKCVAVSNLVESTTNTLVLDMAEGETVDKYIEDLKAEEYDIMSRFFESRNGQLVTDEATGKPKLLLAKKAGASITGSRKELEVMLERLEKRQKFLLSAADKWVEEGIYGSGFFHGDLHAGNIMINDKGLTLIDFGNATKLDETQQKYITRLTAAAAVGDADDFIDAFFKLISKNAKKEYAASIPDFKRAIQGVFRVGDKQFAGQRISLILLKAQSLKIEIPASVSNFSQSQMRLQNTVEDVNKLIARLRKNIDLIDSISEESKVDIFLKCQREAKDKNEKIEITANEYIKKLNIAPVNKVHEKVRLISQQDRSQFNDKYIAIFTEETAAVTQMKEALSRLRNLQDHPENEAAEGSLEVKEAEFITAYQKACNEAVLNSDLATSIRGHLRSTDQAVIDAVEDELKPYFENKANSGAELEAAYKAVKAHQGDLEKEDNFLTLYFSIVSANLSGVIRQRKNAENKIKSFFGTMAKVMNRNIGASLKRFGLFKAYRYKSKLA